MAKGVELATEWVTILPETAQLVKKLKAFKPDPIPVPISFTSTGSGAKSPEKQGAAVGKSLEKGVLTATKDTGEKIGRNMAPDPKPVQQAAAKAGKVIQTEVVKASAEAGKKGGDAIASELEKAKGKVAAASQKLADARRAEENIGSRIRASENKIQQARADTEKKARALAAEEARVARLRESSEEDAATKIAASERKIAQMRDQNARQLVRLNNMEEGHSRLQNTAATNAGRSAGAAENLAAQEAALASAVAQSTKPLEDQQDQVKKSKGLMGGMAASLIPLAKQLLVTSGLFTGAMGIGGGITYVFKTGNEFVDTMNRMQGITNATGTEMAALNDKARALGRDFMLPATSANDAAAAMLELGKTGFTVQQSMDAAKGALQLSAAAGIDAADAARLTGQALNVFGLKATDAGKVTDVLANTANQSAAEMTDVAYSLAQAGGVAKSFGINIEDTATAVGLLANNGIKSSDAGTLIKTMLVSLTDQGKPAQAAMKTLGLELYDQQGKFKGISYVYKKLVEDSKKLTNQQYQAATSTLFGTDAARFAGIAAGHTAEEWDKMRSSIDQEGTAAKVAEARMQGLPGALSRLGNALQSIGLTIYDSVKGPITEVINGIAAVILKFDEWLNGPIKQWLKEYKDEIMGAGAVLLAYGGYLAVVKAGTMAWTAVQWALNAALDANPIGLAVLAIAALVAGVIYAYKHFDWFKKAVDGVWGWIKSTWPTVVGVFKAVWDGIATGISWLWHNVWEPAWEGIKAAWEVAWFAIQLGFAVFKKWIGIIGAIAMDLWQNWIKPAWDGIASGATDMWNLIKEAWGGIKIVIGAVWDWLQPIIQPFKDFFKGVGDAGKAAGEAIKAAWSGLWNILKMPLHGLGGLLAGLPESILGVEVPFVADLHNWGKSLQSLAVGGIAGNRIQGPGTGTSDSIIGINQAGIPTTRVSDGEGIVPVAALATPLGRYLFSMLLGMKTGNVMPDPWDPPGGDSGLPIQQQIPGQFPKGFGPGGQPGGPNPGWTTDFPWPGFPGAPWDPSLIGPRQRNKKVEGAGFNRLPGFANGGLTPGASYVRDIIMKNFGIKDIGGYRPEDGYNEHSTGNALDVMIPNYQSAQGKALGDAVAAFALTNADALGLSWVIWQQRTFNPGDRQGKMMDDRGSDTQNHLDHVHIFMNKNGGQLPQGQLMPASGTIMGHGLSGSPGSISGGSMMGSGSRTVDAKKVREAEDRLQDRQRQLDVAKTRLQEYLDKQKAGKNVKQSTIDEASNQVEKFSRERDEAQTDLATAQQGTVSKNGSSKRGAQGQAGANGQQDWSSVGKMIFSGFLESFGLDGSVFTNLLDTPNVKSAMAGINFLGGLLGGGGDSGGGTSGSGLGGGFMGGGGGDSLGGLGNLGGGELTDAFGGLVAGIGDVAGVDIAPNGGAGDAAQAGMSGGPQFNQDFSGSSFGYSKDEMRQYQDGKYESVSRRFPGLAQGGA